MENEIMNNEDVMVVAEEYTPSNSGTGMLIALGVTGAVGLAIYGAYRLVKHIKAKKASKKEKVEVTDSVEVNVFEKDIDEE